jgi:RHS repeat-associated protein
MTVSATCAIDEVPRTQSVYRGEQYDPDLGLYYLRARYNNPATGRFLGRDPEYGKPINPATLHKYLYAGGDPVDRIDPRGRADTADYTSLLLNESWETKLEMRASAYVVRVATCIAEYFEFYEGVGPPPTYIFDVCLESSL